MERNWQTYAVAEALGELQTNQECGLSENEAARRLELVGLNVLREKKKRSVLRLFFSQFTDFMVIILIIAALISGLLEEYADAVTIVAIIIINAILGFVQEYRAEKSLEALKKMTSPEAKVKRSNRLVKIAAELLVPGDLVYLGTGDIVPADLRLTATSQLEVNEAVLTGESLPVKKNEDAVYAQSSPPGDCRNMVYMGTIVTRGKGAGVVVESGMSTEMGKIADYIGQAQEEETPLQKRLAHLGRWLVFLCLCIVSFVALAGVMRGEPVYRMILVGVSLAVAAIPEGLPAIVTVALAVGVQKMVRQEAIVRALPAVETLGCATVICADKTGTMTQNEMTVRQLYLSGEFIGVSGEGYEPRGELIYPDAKSWLEKNNEAIKRLMKIAVLCNDAVLKKNGVSVGGFFRRSAGGVWKIEGDPTEGALLVVAAKYGVWREMLKKHEKLLYELTFDSDRKCMSVVYDLDGTKMCYAKGAPDVIIDKCTGIWKNGEIVPFTKECKDKLFQANEEMAARALRVLALAYRELPPDLQEYHENVVERELVFVGLIGMIDPPRASAKSAVTICRTAGIKTVMITGDHKKTAAAVAIELGILKDPEGPVVTGTEIEKMSNYQLQKAVKHTPVYARVSPKHKLKIVRALKENGHIVAMTGDGVNDAPAIKEADIGVSMGLSGTEVTREASDLILGNDDFATIVSAVREGRIIYDNIRKFIRYLLGCNIGEVMTMFLAALLGFPLPMIPIQILWMNLVTDGLPAMALGLDPGDPDIMHRQPRQPCESIFAHGLMRRILVRGTVITFVVLFVYLYGYYYCGRHLDLARTMAFTALVFIQLFYVFDCRSERYSIFELGFFTNPFLVWAVLCSMFMQLAVIYLPFFQRTFRTVPLEIGHWILILGLTIGTTLLQGLLRAVKIRRKGNYLRRLING